MSSAARVLWIAGLDLCLLAVWGCAAFEPRPSDEIPFRERVQTKTDGNVRVSVTVLGPKESEAVFGVDLARHGIQPVWLEVENNEDIAYWLLSSGLDLNYFSPLEAAWAGHYTFSGSANREMDEYFRAMAFKNPIYPGAIVSGFVFTNLEEEIKVVDVDLIGREQARNFTFFVPVPNGQRRQPVDTNALYSEDEIVWVDEDELRAALESLPCCATNEDGTAMGDPLNLVLIGHRDDLFSAFVRRGWRRAKTSDSGAGMGALETPQYVFGRKHDGAAEKRRPYHQVNRIRLWLTPMRFEERPVWIGQISRDFNVMRRHEASPVTHKIAPDVDHARNSLVQDLLYSQALGRLGMVRGVRAAAPEEPRSNLAGDPYFTDGLRAVLVFERRAVALTDLEFFEWERIPRRTQRAVD